jgi:hypothetical protein
MDAWKEYSPINDSFVIGIKVDSRDNRLMENLIYRDTIEKASKLLTKLVVRRFLKLHSLDDIANSINVNDIVARSLKINFNFEEQR